MGQLTVPGAQAVVWQTPFTLQLWPIGHGVFGPQSVGQPAVPGVQLDWQTPLTQT